MPKFIIPLVAAALLLPTACCPHKKPCSNRYCAPNAPTRPICPEAKPKCGCKKKAQRRACAPRRAISLSEVTNYLPGLPPGYCSI